ncbi:hypothetical protein [Sphingosinicella sp. CPCC 101087]|uniref:hypothetical protein n=1 Tax=Sphingosinicella sp. CPCC 101087 TaxID=2497754 RepID=UPI00101CAC6F|nr:hypothetical protein [Sphingosinicella sp. CPCC 101087]
MKILLVALAAMAAQAGGPTVAQFQSALAAACPDQPTRTRNVACTRPDEASVQYSCAYEMQGEDGRWARQTAILQQAEGEWVWIDGPTRCSGEEEPELN